MMPVSRDGGLRWPPTLLLYLVSHGFMLASWNAFFWDDWLIYADGRQGTVDHFAECQRCVIPFRGEIEGLLIVPGPWLMRLLVFAFFPVIALFTQQFLRRTQWLHKDEETIIALVILFLPMFGARIALVNYQYAFSLLLFTLGAWMALSPRRVTRLVSLLPVFWSMFTASLQVFVAVLIAVLVTKLFVRQFAVTLDRVLVVASFLLFPFVHRYAIPMFFPKWTVTDGYNTIRVTFLIRAVLVAGILTLPLMTIVFRQRNGCVARRPVVLLAIGLAVVSVGTFPYLAVGHFPNFSDWILPLLPDQSDWNSRHQLLQPFGTAFVILGVSQMMTQYRRAFVLLALGASVCLNVATYSGYYLDSLKQNAVLSYFAENSDNVRATTAVVVEDFANDYNARGRGIRAYEWQAMFESAVGVKVLVDSYSVDYCQNKKPDAILRITPTGGRLKGIVERKAAVNVTLEPFLTCK
jgi:hypothetical protein